MFAQVMELQASDLHVYCSHGASTFSLVSAGISSSRGELRANTGWRRWRPLFDGQDQVVDNLPGRVTPGSSCKLVWTARRSPARQAGEAATETSSYCPLPASRPSCPGGGSCRPG
jgi:hypothetical protein